jgi:predicted AAA+ superfamily ATPase
LLQLQTAARQVLPPERAVYLSFDDDRLAGVDAEQVSLLIEEYYRRFPEWRGQEKVFWILDEIQWVKVSP